MAVRRTLELKKGHLLFKVSLKQKREGLCASWSCPSPLCPDVIRLFLFSIINSNSNKVNARITGETCMSI